MLANFCWLECSGDWAAWPAWVAPPTPALIRLIRPCARLNRRSGSSPNFVVGLDWSVFRERLRRFIRRGFEFCHKEPDYTEELPNNMIYFLLFPHPNLRFCLKNCYICILKSLNPFNIVYTLSTLKHRKVYYVQSLYTFLIHTYTLIRNPKIYSKTHYKNPFIFDERAATLVL